MSLVLLGIDEAGYGPLLGPLCVGACAFHVADWADGQPAPNLWKLLSKGVCRQPTDARGRIPVADSKKLKLANSTQTKHPLIHLERAPLAFLRLMADMPCDDACLYAALGVSLTEEPWYAGDPLPIPVGTTPEVVAIASNMLAAALQKGGVECLGLWCRTVPEGRFNRIVSETGSKAEATATALGEYLRLAFERWGDGSRGPLRVVCDRQGGRIGYGPLLAREVRGASVRVVEESPRCCQYEVHDRDRRMVVTFMPEAETAHLPVALGSMIAKLVRELAMARFNRYWCARAMERAQVELKPTAGYRSDAWRWLQDASAFLSEDERKAMVRIA